MYKSLSADECVRRLLAIENPLVIMHIRPDGDTVGSAAGLMQLFRMLGKNPRYACSDKIPDRLAFLLSDFERAESFEGRTAVTIDIPSEAQIGAILSEIPRPALMIDHHEIGIPFADGYIVGGASSAGEVLFELCDRLIELGKITLTQALAYPIYAAISSDTGCFRYSSTTPTTHRRAAMLIETGIDFSDINHRLFIAKTEAQLRAEAMVADKTKTAMDGRIAYAMLSREDRLKISPLAEDFETAIDVVRSVMGAEIAFVIRETDTGVFKASLRSCGADVAKIAKEFGGGGHIRASGCTVSAESLSLASERLLLRVCEALSKN